MIQKIEQPAEKKAFGLWSAIFLGIGSMVGAGIFIVIGEAGVIAGNLVTMSFAIAAIIALFCGYSLSKLAVRYPSRGGIVEYLIHGYGEGVFSGALGVLFYFAQLVAIAAVCKSFGTYAATYFPKEDTHLFINIFSVSVLSFFVIVNFIGASIVAKAENLIVVIKLFALIIFTVLALFYIQPARLSLTHAPDTLNVFYALGLTFFAFQGFSVITNSVEDMQSPEKTMLKAMVIAILLVTVLYIAVSIAVFGNLSLATILQDKDYALAEAVRPALGEWGFKIIAITALLATASAINATLYAVTQIGYTLAKEGSLPKQYEYHVFNNTEGLLISAILIVPMILLLDLSQIASIAAISVLLIQGFTHTGHLFKVKETKAKISCVIAAVVGSFGAALFAIAYSSKAMPHIVYYILSIFFIAFIFEVIMRLYTNRVIQKQTASQIKK
ncbi:amino acid permease [Pseudoalteromonas sp. NZS100_1]|uniref:APC family permease n=1 Tax=unclassified Pseudoalteromonas TaxID=194690 RepID=UPI0018CE8AD5|nr:MULTISPECIES: APC family permease [unclassified Pseudoalteromonas]MBH0013418.1 amino acid permease [Pseudoalteromonas sp. NZS100_1]MBH0029128.1 amino acid permease [Pseudoalteromonas sp. SWN29]